MTAPSLLILGGLLAVYGWGVLRAYQAAAQDWNGMDRDVRLVFIFVVPIFRGAVRLLLLADSLFYNPRSSSAGPPRGPRNGQAARA
jgi:uncharacterized membrane protein YphA (DoxX/SURF4 family)